MPSVITAPATQPRVTSSFPGNHQTVGQVLRFAGALPVLYSQTLTDAVQSVGYSQVVFVTGGSPAYTFAVTSGSLPPGLSLDAVTGAITGTPTTNGTYTFTVQVTDGNGRTATRSFTIRVDVSIGGGAANYGWVA